MGCSVTPCPAASTSRTIISSPHKSAAKRNVFLAEAISPRKCASSRPFWCGSISMVWWWTFGFLRSSFFSAEGSVARRLDLHSGREGRGNGWRCPAAVAARCRRLGGCLLPDVFAFKCAPPLLVLVEVERGEKCQGKQNSHRPFYRFEWRSFKKFFSKIGLFLKSNAVQMNIWLVMRSPSYRKSRNLVFFFTAVSNYERNWIYLT